EVPALLDEITCNEVSTMKPNQARYNIFTNGHGGAHDDVIIYRLSGRWLIVVNAGNTEKIWRLLVGCKPPGLLLENRTPRYALIALQGPRAVELLQPLCNLDLSTVRYYYAADATVDGVKAEIARTGYTGQDGFEIFV